MLGWEPIILYCSVNIELAQDLWLKCIARGRVEQIRCDSALNMVKMLEFVQKERLKELNGNI